VHELRQDSTIKVTGKVGGAGDIAIQRNDYVRKASSPVIGDTNKSNLCAAHLEAGKHVQDRTYSPGRGQFSHHSVYRLPAFGGELTTQNCG
jgi:hypothetical protein